MDDLNLSFGKEYLNEYNILKYKKTQEELKESTEELLEFNILGNCKYLTLSSKIKSCVSSSKNDGFKTIGESLEKFICKTFHGEVRKQVLNMEAIKKKEIYIESKNINFIKKYGNKIVYIYRINKGTINSEDSGTLLNMMKKYKVYITNKTIGGKVVEFASKSEDQIIKEFTKAKKILQQELKSYEYRGSLVYTNAQDINAEFTTICTINTKEIVDRIIKNTYKDKIYYNFNNDKNIGLDMMNDRIDYQNKVKMQEYPKIMNPINNIVTDINNSGKLSIGFTLGTGWKKGSKDVIYTIKLIY